MKKVILSLVAVLVAAFAFAQAPVKRYVTIEHFTNSNCSICASKNPAFYNTIGAYPSDIHHISIHPPVPYQQCVFYQANKPENSALAAVYNIQGTPRVALNGTLMPSTSQLLPLATLQQYLNLTSPLYVQVIETSGNTRDVTIKLRTQDTIPGGNHKLFAAIVEKTVNQSTPNGEKVHHDVFRLMLTPISGVSYSPAPLGYEVTFNYSYNIQSNWNADEIYVLAYVQNTTTGEILNSGTRFDPIILSAGAPQATRVHFSPNPTGDVAYAQLGDDTAQSVELFDAAGRRVAFGLTGSGTNQIGLQLEGLAPGFYYANIRGEKGQYVAKLVKD